MRCAEEWRSALGPTNPPAEPNTSLRVASIARRPFTLSSTLFLIGRKGTAMTDLERQIIESQLAEIDRRCAELEFMLDTLPPITAQCCDHGREQLELELRDLGYPDGDSRAAKS